jgi:hypothetical protein
LDSQVWKPALHASVVASQASYRAVFIVPAHRLIAGSRLCALPPRSLIGIRQSTLVGMTSKYPTFTFALALMLFGAAGCAYFERESQRTLSELRSAVPEMRSYAVEHLTNLPERDRLLITETEPKILHANYSVFYYNWPGVCDVESFRPPSPPHRVIDRRQEKRGG